VYFFLHGVLLATIFFVSFIEQKFSCLFTTHPTGCKAY